MKFTIILYLYNLLVASMSLREDSLLKTHHLVQFILPGVIQYNLAFTREIISRVRFFWYPNYHDWIFQTWSMNYSFSTKNRSMIWNPFLFIKLASSKFCVIEILLLVSDKLKAAKSCNTVIFYIRKRKWCEVL